MADMKERVEAIELFAQEARDSKYYADLLITKKHFLEMADLIKDLAIENQRYKEALEFYADENSYPNEIDIEKSPIEHDLGCKADQVLKKYGNS